ncbi:MAG: DinB family protein, partial [Chloroflexi bacterium]|nr:DinB family protein [Chloroflexota bacterium]
MIDLEGTIRQLAASAEAIRVLVEAVAEVQAEWQPDPKSWSLKEVMRHLYSEESTDFRRHLRELWHEPPIL